VCFPMPVGKAPGMNDQDILERIHRLVEEEDDLRSRGDGVDDRERARLDALERDLDQCWDLLRRRRAKRDTGQEPDAVQPRPEETVERYLQ
jgi:hypothetical protein